MSCKYSFQSTYNFLFYWAYFHCFYFYYEFGGQEMPGLRSKLLFSGAMMLDVLPLCCSSSPECPKPARPFPTTFQSSLWLSPVLLPGFILVLSEEEQGKLVYATLPSNFFWKPNSKNSFLNFFLYFVTLSASWQPT